MTDDLERRLSDWMQEDGDVPAAEVSRVAGTVSTLPTRGRGPYPALAFAAVLVLIVSVGALVTWPGGGLLGGAASPDPARTRGGKLTSTPTSAPTPPDPAAFSGDPRLLMCSGVDVSRVEFAFEMRHAADYRRHLPAMLLSPELDVPEPAFVAVYRQGDESPLQGAGAAPPPGTTWPPRSFTPGHRDVCVVVASGELNIYQDVDITGMQATLPGDAAGSPVPSLSPSPSPTPKESIASGPIVTPSPAPAITEAPTEPGPTASPSYVPGRVDR